MPVLTNLSITNFRNISNIDLGVSTGINVFFGENGSGKTSILEAINTLSQGRSFRTNRSRNVVKDGEDSLVVRGRFCNSADDTHTIAIQKSSNSKNNVGKLDGRLIRGASEIAHCFPVLSVNNFTFSLLEGSPKDRRRFLDWLVFHVKHSFSDSWQEVSKAYKQRNIMLRRGKISYRDVEVWDRLIATKSVDIYRCRAAVFENWRASVLSQLEQFCKEGEDHPLRSVDSLALCSGWGAEPDKESGIADDAKLASLYLSALESHFERDVKQGYSRLGPHRADIKVKVGSKSAVDVLSRGQQKVLLALMVLGQGEVFTAKSGLQPVFLLDDIGSELDSNARAFLGNWLFDTGCQVFVTGVDPQFASDFWPEEREINMFHVKHGSVEQIEPSC